MKKPLLYLLLFSYATIIAKNNILKTDESVSVHLFNTGKYDFSAYTSGKNYCISSPAEF
jgi:hypothetical protein